MKQYFTSFEASFGVISESFFLTSTPLAPLSQNVEIDCSSLSSLSSVDFKWLMSPLEGSEWT